MKGWDQWHKVQWRQVTGDVLQGLVLGPILFCVIVISDLNDGAEYILRKFTDGTKLGGVADIPKGCAAVQRDLNRPKEWTDRNFMKFNKGKRTVLHLGGTAPCTSMCWKATWQKGAWGSWWQVEQYTKNVPLWQRQPTASTAALGRVLPAGRGRWSFPSAHLECCVYIWAPQYKRNMDIEE